MTGRKISLMPWGGFFDVETSRTKIEELEKRIASPDFWTSSGTDGVMQELKALKNQTGPYFELVRQQKDLAELLSIIEDSDTDSLKSLEKESAEFGKKFEALEFQKLLSGPTDKNSAILSINAGAGGTEACDWVSMLLRMYTRYAEDHGYKTDIIDMLVGEEAGVKNVTMTVEGPYANGYLKSENGVHRLVRISPFDSNKRRHTSFASVEVIPEVDDNFQIDIKDSDIRVDVFRSGGKGGQGVNTTDSAVRITHLATGLVVQCQKERSQIKNKATALKVLKSRLFEREMDKRMAEAKKTYNQKSAIAWGSQIRSYVLYPYKMVKDHRTDYETSNSNAVLDGDIQGFLEAFLKSQGKN